MLRVLEHSPMHCYRGLLWFRRWADFLEVIAIVLSGVGSVFAYLAGIEENKWWAFISGMLGTLSFGLTIIGRYCNSQSKERTTQLNKILSRFYVPKYPGKFRCLTTAAGLLLTVC
jgi:hypothetical protein